MELIASTAKSDAASQSEAELLLICVDERTHLLDSLGPSALYKLEQLVQNRLSEQLSAGDALCNLGQLEFALLIRRATAELRHNLAERLRSAISTQACSLDGDEVALSISVGRAEKLPNQPDAERWLKRAQLAAARAERAGGNRVMQGLDTVIGPRPERNAVILALLAEPPSRNNSNLQFMPWVPLRGAPLSQYLLQLGLRGQTVATANVDRADYLALAESKKLIARVDRFALQRAVDSIGESHRLGGSVTVHFSCSGVSLLDDLVANVKQEVSRFAVDPRALVLHFDLHQLELDAVVARRKLAELRELKVRIATNVAVVRSNLRGLLTQIAPEFIDVHQELLSATARSKFPQLRQVLIGQREQGAQLLVRDVSQLDLLDQLWRQDIDYVTSTHLAPARNQFDFAFSSFRPQEKSA